MTHIFSLKRFLCVSIVAANLAATPVFANNPPMHTNTNWGNWQGGYVGGFIGGEQSEFTNNSGTPGPFGTETSFMGGGDLGYNWQNNRVVYGVEGDFTKFNNSAGQGGVKFTEDWMTTVRGRLGYSMGRFLPYATGGIALTDVVSKVSGAGTDERIQPGYTFGGGMDTMLSSNWFGRVEYLYADVPRDSVALGATTVAGGSTNHALRLGLNYKF
jgi:outer membrane immunogenic protein